MYRLWTILTLCFWMTWQMVFASAGLVNCDLHMQAETCCCTAPVEPVSCCSVPVEADPCTCHLEAAPEPMATLYTHPYSCR